MVNCKTENWPSVLCQRCSVAAVWKKSRLAFLEEAGGKNNGRDKKAGGDEGRVDGVQPTWDADVQMQRGGSMPRVGNCQRG